MKKRKNAIRRMVARAMTLVMAAVMVLGGIPSIPARAEGGAYPYMIFAVSDDEGAVTLNANNTGLNGSVATNGTIAVIGGNCNINGTRTERAGEGGELIGMPDLRERIMNTYFASGTEEHAEDYTLEETNINVNTPIEGGGEVSLTGNINLNAGIMAQEDIVLDGEVKNSGDVVLYSASGNVVINSTNVNLNGLVYAPYGEIRITSMNVNMNNVILIAQKVTIEANGINGGMNQGIAQFIGTEYNVIEGRAGNDHPVNPDNPDPVDPENPGSEEPDPVDPENPEIDWSVDTDGDGLPDALEEEVGTDPEMADTDGDGLSDFEEMILIGTDPVNPSSVQSGVLDADADSDGDGIPNREELDKGLNPASADSDYDGISDYDELYVYGTDPVNADSDGDGIKDGDEISLGLDPLNGSTNGVPDGEYMIHQTVDADSEALAGINTTENPYRLSIELDASGYVEGNIIARESPYAVSVENDAVLGTVAGLEYQDGIVENVTLQFEITEPYRENVSGLYAQYSEANQGIRRFTVFCWVDEVNMMVPVRTQYDLEHNSVYAEVNGLGTYCLIDRELWYEQLGIMPDDMDGLYENSIQTYAAVMDNGVEAAAADTGKESYALINGESKKVYLYGGHMYAVYAGPATWTEAKVYCESLGGHLAVITSQEEQDFIEEYVLTADTAPRFWIGGYSESYPFDFQWVTGEEFDYTNWAVGEPNFSSELYIEIYGNYNGWDGCWNNYPVNITQSFICEWEEESVSGNDIRVYNALKLIALPEDFGAVSIHSTQDYDGDGLLDVEEIMFGHVLYGEPDENGEYELPTFGDVLVYVVDQYSIELPEEWGLGDDALKELFDTKVVLVLSDPTRVDTDGEGIPDNIDIRPIKYDDYADKYIEFINAGYIDMNKMIQTRDGFTICMTPLPEMLLNMGYEEYDFDCLCEGSPASGHGMSEVAADWYLYSVETNKDTVFSLIKLRDTTGYNIIPSVAVPFIELDIDQMQTYSNPDNLALLDAEFDNIIYAENAKTNHVLSAYFVQPESDALYVIPQIYVRLVIQNECIDQNINKIYMTREGSSKYALATLEKYQVGNGAGNPEIYDDNGTNDKTDDYIVIVDPYNPTLAEQECILAMRSGNPSFDSFAAEIVYHAKYADNVFVHDHTVKADLSVEDQQPLEREYKADNSSYVKSQIAVSGGGIPEDLILKLDWSAIFA